MGNGVKPLFAIKAGASGDLTLKTGTTSNDGVPVSNFLLPSYYSREHDAGARTDFKGRPLRGEALPAFGLTKGGYLCFWEIGHEIHKLPAGAMAFARAPNRFSSSDFLVVKKTATSSVPRSDVVDWTPSGRLPSVAPNPSGAPISSQMTYSGNGAAMLLYNRAQRTVILTQQFRYPAFYRGEQPFLLEVCAGKLDRDDPEICARKEAVEVEQKRLKQC